MAGSLRDIINPGYYALSHNEMPTVQYLIDGADKKIESLSPHIRRIHQYLKKHGFFYCPSIKQGDNISINYLFIDDTYKSKSLTLEFPHGPKGNEAFIYFNSARVGFNIDSYKEIVNPIKVLNTEEKILERIAEYL